MGLRGGLYHYPPGVSDRSSAFIHCSRMHCLYRCCSAYQPKIQVSDIEEQNEAHIHGKIDRFLDEDRTVTFQVSKSTRETRLATKALQLHFSLEEAESRLSPPKTATWCWTVSVSAQENDSTRYSLERSGAGRGSLVFDASALAPGREETFSYDDHSEGETGLTFRILSARETLVVHCRRNIQSWQTTTQEFGNLQLLCVRAL
jgi:hypothetical protein